MLGFQRLALIVAALSSPAVSRGERVLGGAIASTQQDAGVSLGHGPGTCTPSRAAAASSRATSPSRH